MFEEEKLQKQTDTIYCSLGNYCITGWLLKSHNLKFESYPFEWMVTCLDNIIDCIEDDFNSFLDKTNYLQYKNGTINKKYIKSTQYLFGENFIKYDHQHHNLLTDTHYNYLQRCINRFNDIKKLNL